MTLITQLRAFALTLCGLGIALSSGAVQAQQQALPPGYKAEYKLSTVLGNAFPWGKGGDIWADLVRERTKGRINIKSTPAPHW